MGGFCLYKIQCLNSYCELTKFQLRESKLNTKERKEIRYGTELFE